MVVVEVTRKAYLASLVPVIVDAILNEHQVIADIVAFVSHGDFPRSRLGEKQRGKVLASWVTRKLRTIAQFSIRDVEGPEHPFAEAPQHRVSRSSKPGSTMGNSTRRSTVVPDVDLMPRSPAPVLVEHSEATMGSYPPIPEPSIHSPTGTLPEGGVPSVPHIAEPIRPTSASTNGAPAVPRKELPTTISNPDFGFDFGDFANSATAGSLTEPVGHGPMYESLPYRTNVPAHDAPQRAPSNGSYPVRSDSYNRTPLADSMEGSTGDWPQEALMYQANLGYDDAHGPHRNQV